MNIDIPDDLNRRLQQLAKGTGQPVEALVCEAIEQRLALEEQHAKRPDRSRGNDRSQETNQPIWQRFEDTSLELPDDELDRLPTDGSLQHDHYLYGTPKRLV
jgi:hypothetical protein